MYICVGACALYSTVQALDNSAALAQALPPGWTGAAGVYYTINSGNCAVPPSHRPRLGETNNTANRARRVQAV